MKEWVCSKCETHNIHTDTRCEVCNQPRSELPPPKKVLVSPPEVKTAPTRPRPTPSTSPTRISIPLKAEVVTKAAVVVPDAKRSTFWDVLVGLVVAGLWLIESAPLTQAPVLLVIGAVTSVVANRSYGGSNHPDVRDDFPSHVLAGIFSGSACMLSVGIVSMTWDAFGRGAGQGFAALFMYVLFFWMYVLLGIPVGLVVGLVVGTVRTVFKL